MRPYLILSAALVVGPLLFARPALAQTAPPALPTPVNVGALPALGIPPPPGGKLRVEMDARSEDVLGVLKSFLKGIGETNGTRRSVNSPRPVTPSPVADALEGGDLADMLRDVNHVHFVVYELPGAKLPSLMPTATISRPIIVNPMTPKPLGKKGGKTLVVPLAAPVIPATPPVPAFDSNAFYETAFDAEGAHRILFTDADQYKLVMVGFPDRKGYAFAVSGGGYVAVSRTDGYPNLEALTAFLSRVTDAALRSQTMNKMIKDGMKAGTDPSDSDPAASSLKK